VTAEPGAISAGLPGEGAPQVGDRPGRTPEGTPGPVSRGRPAPLDLPAPLIEPQRPAALSGARSFGCPKRARPRPVRRCCMLCPRLTAGDTPVQSEFQGGCSNIIAGGTVLATHRARGRPVRSAIAITFEPLPGLAFPAPRPPFWAMTKVPSTTHSVRFSPLASVNSRAGAQYLFQEPGENPALDLPRAGLVRQRAVR
jgi:hypothetical protein